MKMIEDINFSWIFALNKIKIAFYLVPFVILLACAGGGNDGGAPKDLRNHSDPIVSEAERLRVSADDAEVKYKEIVSQYLQTHDKLKLQLLLEITNDVNQKARRATQLYSQQRYASQGIAGSRWFFSKYAFQQCGLKACSMLIETADLYANGDDKSVAKSLYREIIVTYTDPIFESYVRKAEFGLEDLRGSSINSN